MSKRSMPWLKWYPADWLSDSVAGCSLAARGLWLEMLCIMHASERYGHLEADDKPIPDEMVARRCRCASVEEYRNLLAELFSAGVPSRTSEGIIYNRRMVRDQQDRDADAKRQRRHREQAPCHASVTPMSQEEVRGQRSEGRGQSKEKKDPAAKTTPPADPRHKPFFDFAYETFRKKFLQPPTWGPKHYKGLSLFLAKHKHVTQEEWERRYLNFLASTDRFYQQEHGSLVIFVGHFDSFIDGPILEKGNGSGKKLTGSDLTDANLRAAGFVQ